MAVIDESRVRERCGTSHWQHFLRTAATAARLAERFGVDVEKARLAGLLHDYARSIGREDLVKRALEYGIEVGPVERRFPYLLHAQVGARLAEDELGVDDEKVLDAIRYHTLGRVGMSDLEKIVYLSDMIEPERRFEGVESIREAAESDLDRAFRLGYRLSLEHLVASGKLIHPATVEVWNWLHEKGER